MRNLSATLHDFSFRDVLASADNLTRAARYKRSAVWRDCLANSGDHERQRVGDAWARFAAATADRSSLMQHCGGQTARATLAPSRSHHCHKARLARHYAFLLTLSPYLPPPLSASWFRCTLFLRFPPRALFVIATFHLPLRSAFAFILHCARSLRYDAQRRRRRSARVKAPKSHALKYQLNLTFSIILPLPE